MSEQGPSLVSVSEGDNKSMVGVGGAGRERQQQQQQQHLPQNQNHQHQGEEEKLEHMKSVADDLVAKLVSEEDDLRPPQSSTSSCSSSANNPGVTTSSGGPVVVEAPSHHDPSVGHPPHSPPQDKWFYTDPQVIWSLVYLVMFNVGIKESTIPQNDQYRLEE